MEEFVVLRHYFSVLDIREQSTEYRCKNFAYFYLSIVIVDFNNITGQKVRIMIPDKLRDLFRKLSRCNNCIINVFLFNRKTLISNIYLSKKSDHLIEDSPTIGQIHILIDFLPTNNRAGMNTQIVQVHIRKFLIQLADFFSYRNALVMENHGNDIERATKIIDSEIT